MLLFENIKSLVRDVLTGVGAVLVVKGVASPAAVDSVASGVADIAVGGLALGVSYVWTMIRNSKISKYLPK